uniref:Putative zinc-or iron-chelating protein n=1 Tax=viral metagenome TaxID=1070528 RepID=A0A6M3LZ21_9ZZZZ
MLKPTNKEHLELPGNPCLQETVADFLRRQKSMLSEDLGQDSDGYECKRCGDCCTWNYYVLDINDPKLLDSLYMLAKYPHGYWRLDQKKIRMYMPFSKNGLMDFDGVLPDKHIEHLTKTGRMHGYWVLDTKNDKILVYNPVPCLQLAKDGDQYYCIIYKDRPQVCKDYSCRRYPID